jgi:naphthalene 1,2-dioxygenase ferredoxin component
MNNWKDLVAEEDLFEGAGICIELEGRELAVFKLEDGIFAIDNICSHGAARLCDGFVDGHQVECPFHQALFDVRDGSVCSGPATEPVKSWPIQVVNGRVQVKI